MFLQLFEKSFTELCRLEIKAALVAVAFFDKKRSINDALIHQPYSTVSTSGDLESQPATRNAFCLVTNGSPCHATN